ncbi:sugar nucleotide-binding protein [Thalassoglobus polymorphus]|uniref:dTDP-4-dehydrorhamnose reductase n=1 Tax=Thalassoglobus polymorphus TaxID=2527994 RepID=A0A517QT50_9PLAN|nr:sugar nucleotide-binding protein [Thalassoglobus polymorphus]QDT34727.1 RmlD substrate binding domain protein [Thalassoglobus polymorphus]
MIRLYSDLAQGMGGSGRYKATRNAWRHSVDKFLIVGVDTVAGANLALSLAEKYHVTTWHPEEKFDVVNCDALDPTDSPCAAIENAAPDWVIYCGPESRSSWDPTTKGLINETIVENAGEWANASTKANVRFLMISSDSLFTGPWMFHDEQSLGHCQSVEAVTIRAAEEAVRLASPHALIMRTNAYGWSADPSRNGWIENLLAEVEMRRVVEQDSIRHATPILITDLTAIIERACLENLSGTYHVAGAERVSPLNFTQRLSDLFELPWLAIKKETTLTEVPQDFASGECSLQTKEIRKALCVAMPLLSEGLQRLHEQSVNGYRDKLVGNRNYKAISRVA